MKVSQTSDTQRTLCFKWELLGRWQLWPSSPDSVQQPYELSLDLSHNMTLFLLPGLLVLLGSWEGLKRCSTQLSCKISLANHLGITRTFFPHIMEQADEEEEATPTGKLWEYDLLPNLFCCRWVQKQPLPGLVPLVDAAWLLTVKIRDSFLDAFHQSVTALHSSTDGQQPAKNSVILSV